MFNPINVAWLVGTAGFFWLALYLLLRTRQRSTLIKVSLIALLSMTVYFARDVVCSSLSDPAIYALIQRATMWSAYLPLAAWVHVCALVKRQVISGEGEQSEGEQSEDEQSEGEQSEGAAQPRHPRLHTPLPILFTYAATLIIIIISTATPLIVDYGAPTAIQGALLQLPLGPLYPLNIIFNGALTGIAIAYLWQALRRMRHQQQPQQTLLYREVRLIAAGAALFLIGALWLPTAYLFELGAAWGSLALISGLAIVGYAIAQFGLLLEGQNARRDFIYSFTGIIILHTIYLSVLGLAGILTPTIALLTMLLVTLTHSLFDVGRDWLDRLFFTPEEQRARTEARTYATALGTAPVATATLPRVPNAPDDDPTPSRSHTPITGQLTNPDSAPDNTFKHHTRRAITALKSPPKLAESPLLSLPLITARLHTEQRDDNRLNRAAVLRELLREYIHALRPTDDEATPISDAWRYYNVLYYPYVREISRKGALGEIRQLERARQRQGRTRPDDLEQVLNWLVSVEDATFYKWQRQASDTIAASLWEDNVQAQ
ncbi:MAG: hypothetical protein HC911_14670 [Chloroflexaceae bacterium]|nr:hypothetical protein [Chloroflexaceae bacterium]